MTMLPRVMRIMGQAVQIEDVADPRDPIEVHGHEGHGHSVLGSFEPTTLSVKVRTTGVATDKQREALLHEALHGIVDAGSLLVYLHGDNEEPFVKTLAPQLLMFLRDNPHVVDYLMEGTR